MHRCLIPLVALAVLGFGHAQDAVVDLRDRSIGEILNATGAVAILNAMVESAGLDTTLSSGGPYTVFAPVDRGWVEVDRTTLSALLSGDPAALDAVLRHHVVSGEVASGRLFDLLIADALRRIGDAPADGEEVDDDHEIADAVEALLATGVTSAVRFETLQGTALEVVATRTSRTAIGTGEDAGAGQGTPAGEPPAGNSAPLAALRADGVDVTVGLAGFVSLDILASNGVIHLIDRVLVPEGVPLPD